MKPLVKISSSSVSEEKISILDGKLTIPTRQLIERVILAPTSVLIASGSLIEGIGTIHSDIDCIVLCDERPKAAQVKSIQHALVTDINYRCLSQNEEVHNTTDFFEATSLHIDTDYITFSEWESAILKIEKAFDQIAGDQRFLYDPVLSDRENNFIHRTRIGFALENQTAFNRLRSEIPVEKHLYVAHREKLPVFYAFQDVQGCWQSGNLWMGCEIVRDMMLKTTMSFTYLTGVTNKHYKWVYSNMFRVDGYEEIKTEFFRLARKGAITEEECRLYIEEVLEYMDMVFMAIEVLLERCRIYPSRQASLLALNNEFERRGQVDHKISKCEYFFRKKYFSAMDTPRLTSLLKEWD